MWVAIVGSRTFGDCSHQIHRHPTFPPTPEEKEHAQTCPSIKARELVRHIVVKWSTRPGFQGIVSGAAIGADSLAREACELLGTTILEIPVPSTPREASFRERALGRNSTIVAKADVVVALFSPGPRSPGTSDTLRKAKQKGVPTYIWHQGSWSTD